MNNWIQAARQRERLRPRRGCLPSTCIPMLLLLGGLLVWAPMRADGQIFSISQIANTNVLVGMPITIQISITNTTGATSSLGWSLSSNPTTDASIAPTNTGPQDSTIFSWTPTQAVQVTFAVTAIQIGSQYANTMIFSVTATNSTSAGTPPYLALPFSTTNITFGMTLTLTAFATNTDGSANALTFSLGTNALAAGATIANSTPTNGLFQWTPSAAQAGFVYPMEVIVTEQTNPPLSTTQTLTVNVILTNNCVQYDQVLLAAANGGTVTLTNCPTLVVSDTIVVTASNVVLNGISNNVTIAGNNLMRLFTVLPGASLTLNGLTLLGGQSDNGGAIYNTAGGTVMLSNCVFAGNSAVGTSGTNGVDGDSDPNYGRNGTDASSGLAGVGGAILNLGALIANSC